ncbi:4-oxalomesaconate tautomerase [Streptomyces bauhiniae]
MSAVSAAPRRWASGAGSQTAIPSLFMRGGTSRGPFFDARTLPDDLPTRDAVLLAALGSPDARQIDGVGGAHPLTSKLGMVRPAGTAEADLEWTFAQIQPGGDTVDTSANCGNMLAAVVPFAIETGMLTPAGDRTSARVLTRNTGMVAEITVPTPADGSGTRYVSYQGPARIDGVPGTAAAVEIGFLDTAGSVAGALLPTGRVRDTVDVPDIGPVEVTLIDNGQPLVIVAAERLGATGYETPAEIDADTALKARVEALRLVCGSAMGLGDVTSRNYPKMTLVAPPRYGGALSTRSLIPRLCHQSIGVLAAVTAATACALEGSVAHDLADGDLSGARIEVSVEHPAGAFDVTLGRDPGDARRFTRSALVRTARLLMAGDLFVPRSVWDPATAPTASALQKDSA